MECGNSWGPSRKVLSDYGTYSVMTVHSKSGIEEWEIHSRYLLKDLLGSGGYGVVCSAVDQVTGSNVAIKRVSRPFQRRLDAIRLLRELKLLRFFRGHENVMTLLDIMMPRLGPNFNDIYIVSELMDSDLQEILRHSKQFTLEHAQFFLYQILRAIRYVHASGVVHRDLKPSNILINRNCDLRVCDFGLARALWSTESSFHNPFTMYVTTRWYRPPEVVLCSSQYTYAVDVWSIGCILAEMLGKLEPHSECHRPLFPGRDYRDQLAQILNVLGTPNDDDLMGIGSENAISYLKRLSYSTGCRFDEMYPNAPSEAIDLLSGMLRFNPSSRITVDDALRHPFIQDFLEQDDIDPFPNIPSFDHSFENASDEQLKGLVYEEMRQFHPELPFLQ